MSLGTPAVIIDSEHRLFAKIVYADPSKKEMLIEGRMHHVVYDKPDGGVVRIAAVKLFSTLEAANTFSQRLKYASAIR